MGTSARGLRTTTGEPQGRLWDQLPIALWFRNYSAWPAFTRPASPSKGNLTVLVHPHRVWMQNAFGELGL